MSQLSREKLRQLRNRPNVIVPDEAIFQLPEKVLQFGTGNFLRGLSDFFIDEANRQGIFNGRIIVVKSTGTGDLKAFNRQNNLYTICSRGLVNGVPVENNVVCSAISRVLYAKSQWSLVLDLAKNPAISIVISNTTETGIQLVQDDIYQWPPVSFPGKLLAFLYARYVAFGGSPAHGVTIIPTELISDNGTRLESIVLELAHRNGLESNFIDWLEQHNRFCNSLVDRIVPGRPEGAKLDSIEEELGYRDELLVTTEHYHLWAIEGGDEIRGKLPFYGINKGLVIQPDIQMYRELKLRLLNGTHTLACGLAHLCGFVTVYDAMNDPHFSAFIAHLMQQEIATAIPYVVDMEVALKFCAEVQERFKNPFIEHKWLTIAQNYSAKLLARVMPVFETYLKEYHTPPDYITFGLASYIYFMKTVRKSGDSYLGQSQGIQYQIPDSKAPFFHQKWQLSSLHETTLQVFRDSTIWGRDLSKNVELVEMVNTHLRSFIDNGVSETLKAFLEKTELALPH
jgi:tagaturonate reductase